MSTIRITALICLLAACAPAVEAQRFAAPGGASVYRLDDTRFEVVATSSKGYRTYWCAAATYARRALDAPWDARISVARGLGPSEATGRISAVQFTLAPEALGVTPIRSPSPNAYDLGDTNSVTEANYDCDKLRFRL